LLAKHRSERWVAALCIFVLASVLWLAGVIEPFEHRLIEVRSKLLDRAPSGQLAIIEIDARSLAALNTWPWSRRYHAELLDRLRAAGASIIAFDVDFSAQSDASGDQEFRNALRRTQPVILPIFQQPASDATGSRIVKNHPAATFDAAWVGNVNIIPGRDGVVRDFPAATMINGQIQPSMAVLLSENDSVGDKSFIPDWSIDVRRIPRFSFIDVLNGRVPRRSISGKRFIVGATAIEMGDRYTVPRFGTVSGVVIQALAAESLIQHRALTRSGFVPTTAGVLLAALLVILNFKPFALRFGVSAAGFLITLLMIPLAVQSRWPFMIDTSPALAALGVAIIVRIILEVRVHLQIAALRDAATGLPNQRALVAALDETDDPALSVTAASIARFDAIRSAVPSATVEETVAKAASRISALISAPVFRIAPDTLAWITTADANADQECESVSRIFAQPVETERAPIDIAWTFGTAAMAPGLSSAQVLERAIAAVADGRKHGYSRYRFQGITTDALRDLSMMGELRRGLESGQLFVAYQPKLHLRSSKISHAEALVRWRHPTDGLVAPDRFIPLAEETGVVREITRFVLRQAIADCLAAAKAGTRIGVSINVSATDLGRADFAQEIIWMVSGAGLDPADLTFEVTESSIIRSKQTAIEVLRTLRDHGFRLSIDDYGTGQSTLSYLKTLPVHELKIDKSFITSLGHSERDHIMVKSTIDLAHALGLTVVAEGVEDIATARRLNELECDYAQGYLVGQAMPLKDLLSTASVKLRDAA
jgi:EAL domain-containing protein (putative c-di-GMP-specific phosphodiesterase class I)/CHASE2 domain-containing sensor protein